MRLPRTRRAATGSGGQQVYAITATPRSLSADVDARTKRYLLSMGIRTGCFVGALLATGWLRWAFLAGAILLPYIAVVVANGGRERTADLPSVVVPSRLALGPPPAPEGGRRAPDGARRGTDAA